jgi:hypothetical protein
MTSNFFAECRLRIKAAEFCSIGFDYKFLYKPATSRTIDAPGYCQSGLELAEMRNGWLFRTCLICRRERKLMYCVPIGGRYLLCQAHCSVN